MRKVSTRAINDCEKRVKPYAGRMYKVECGRNRFHATLGHPMGGGTEAESKIISSVTGVRQSTRNIENKGTTVISGTRAWTDFVRKR